MNARTYGYARVSTQSQKADRQVDRLLELGIDRKRIYVDKASGKDFDRPEYKRLKKVLKSGDLLVLVSVDRLGRNYTEIQSEWRTLTRLGADIMVLDMPLLDTRRNVEEGLIGTFVADIVLQTLSFASNLERDNIRERQREGIRSAKARGVKFGRPAQELPENFSGIYRRWKDGEITASEAARILQMPVSTFRYRASKQEEEAEGKNK